MNEKITRIEYELTRNVSYDHELVGECGFKIITFKLDFQRALLSQLFFAWQ
jgi:hypothetical protein